VNFARRGDPNGEGVPAWPVFSDSNHPLRHMGVQSHDARSQAQVTTVGHGLLGIDDEAGQHLLEHRWIRFDDDQRGGEFELQADRFSQQPPQSLQGFPDEFNSSTWSWTVCPRATASN
jgi:hypothetical protein